MSKRGRRRMSLEIEEAMYNELKRIAKEKKMSISTIVRNLIIEYILEVRATRDWKTEEEIRER